MHNRTFALNDKCNPTPFCRTAVFRLNRNSDSELAPIFDGSLSESLLFWIYSVPVNFIVISPYAVGHVHIQFQQKLQLVQNRQWAIQKLTLLQCHSVKMTLNISVSCSLAANRNSHLAEKRPFHLRKWCPICGDQFGKKLVAVICKVFFHEVIKLIGA